MRPCANRSYRQPTHALFFYCPVLKELRFFGLEGRHEIDATLGLATSQSTRCNGPLAVVATGCRLSLISCMKRWKALFTKKPNQKMLLIGLVYTSAKFPVTGAYRYRIHGRVHLYSAFAVVGIRQASLVMKVTQNSLKVRPLFFQSDWICDVIMARHYRLFSPLWGGIRHEAWPNQTNFAITWILSDLLSPTTGPTSNLRHFHEQHYTALCGTSCCFPSTGRKEE